MSEIDDNVAMPRQLAAWVETDRKRDAALKLAKSIHARGGIGKSTAAKMALSEVGLWAVIEQQSAVDYLRNNI